MTETSWKEAGEIELAEAIAAGGGAAREEFARRFGKGLEGKFHAFRKRVGAFSIRFEDFLCRVAEAACSSFLKKRKRGGSGGLADLLGKLALEDVYLATACAAGDPAAWEVFDRKYRGYIHAVARSLVKEESLAAELSGGLYGDLYVREAGADPSKSRIGGFTGRGSLFGWLRVVVFHKAMDLFRERKGALSYEAVSEGGGEGRIVPKKEAARSPMEEEENREMLREVVAGEIGSLSPRERGVLCFYYLEGLREREIGRVYGVHEATVSRWIKKAREKVRRGIERRLRREHRFSREEVGLFFDWAAGAEEAGIAALFKKGASGDAFFVK